MNLEKIPHEKIEAIALTGTALITLVIVTWGAYNRARKFWDQETKRIEKLKEQEGRESEEKLPKLDFSDYLIKHYLEGKPPYRDEHPMDAIIYWNKTEERAKKILIKADNLDWQSEEFEEYLERKCKKWGNEEFCDVVSLLIKNNPTARAFFETRV